jgi:transposase
VLIHNNWIDSRIQPVALGRLNGLFAGSARGGQRATRCAVMSLIQSARLNRFVPEASLRDMLKRLPNQPNSRIDEMLPRRWTPVPAT